MAWRPYMLLRVLLGLGEISCLLLQTTASSSTPLPRYRCADTMSFQCRERACEDAHARTSKAALELRRSEHKQRA
jgi:hypothetical protein